MVTGLYRGYSSFENDKNLSFSLRDIKLVEMDLLNHIFTKLGERVMMPTFGTIIPTLVFEPLDQGTLDILDQELRKVFAYDPRVNLMSLVLTPNYDTNSVTVAANLFYIELATVNQFDLNIEFES